MFKNMFKKVLNNLKGRQCCLCLIKKVNNGGLCLICRFYFLRPQLLKDLTDIVIISLTFTLQYQDSLGPRNK